MWHSQLVVLHLKNWQKLPILKIADCDRLSGVWSLSLAPPAFDVWNESQFALRQDFRKPELADFDFVSLPLPSFLSFFWYSFWTGFFVVAVFFEICPKFCAGSIIQSVLAIRTLRQFSYDLALLPSESLRSILSHCITSLNFSLSNYIIQFVTKLFVWLDWNNMKYQVFHPLVNFTHLYIQHPEFLSGGKQILPFPLEFGYFFQE